MSEGEAGEPAMPMNVTQSSHTRTLHDALKFEKREKFARRLRFFLALSGLDGLHEYLKIGDIYGAAAI